jgi:hypothetical protein
MRFSLRVHDTRDPQVEFVEAMAEMTGRRGDEASIWAERAHAALLRAGLGSEELFDRALDLRVKRIALAGTGRPPWDPLGLIEEFEAQSPYTPEEAVARSHDIRSLMSFVETAEMPVVDMMRLRRLKAQVATLSGLLACPVDGSVKAAVRRWADIRSELS